MQDVSNDLCRSGAHDAMNDREIGRTESTRVRQQDATRFRGGHVFQTTRVMVIRVVEAKRRADRVAR